MTDETLFQGFDETEPPTTMGERRRARQKVAMDAGYHPLHVVIAGVRLHPDAPTDVPKGTRTAPLTCGTCIHRVIYGGHAKKYPKCDLPGRSSNSEATDVQSSWPACTEYVRDK